MYVLKGLSKSYVVGEKEKKTPSLRELGHRVLNSPSPDRVNFKLLSWGSGLGFEREK